jgi:hypothetical protein
VQHAVVGRRIDDRCTGGIGALECRIAAVVVFGKGSPDEDRLRIDDVTQHVFARPVQFAQVGIGDGERRTESFLSTLSAQEIHQVGSRGGSTLIDCCAGAVAEIRIVAEQGNFGCIEVGLFRCDQVIPGGSGRGAAGVAGIGNPR